MPVGLTGIGHMVKPNLLAIRPALIGDPALRKEAIVKAEINVIPGFQGIGYDSICIEFLIVHIVFCQLILP